VGVLGGKPKPPWKGSPITAIFSALKVGLFLGAKLVVGKDRIDDACKFS